MLSESENFRQPQVLADLLVGLDPTISRPIAHVAGWEMHYTVAALFSLTYNILWENKVVKPSIPSSLALGAASGLLGITGWAILFKSHPDPPKKQLSKFFRHLVADHVVFGSFTEATYRMIKDKNRFWA